jgi:hypothetical protein
MPDALPAGDPSGGGELEEYLAEALRDPEFQAAYARVLGICGPADRRCDPDCEVNDGDHCAGWHVLRWKRGHDPSVCDRKWAEITATAEGNPGL